MGRVGFTMTTKRIISTGMGRRRFIQESSLLMGTALSGGQESARPSLIKNENRKEGTRDWQLTRVRTQGGARGFRSPWIEGYCSRQNVEAGQTLDIKVSTDPGQVIGRTDDFAYRVVEDPVPVHDLHATVLHLMGLDHTKLTYRFQGRDYRLTDVSGTVVTKLLA